MKDDNNKKKFEAIFEIDPATNEPIVYSVSAAGSFQDEVDSVSDRAKDLNAEMDRLQKQFDFLSQVLDYGKPEEVTVEEVGVEQAPTEDAEVEVFEVETPAQEEPAAPEVEVEEVAPTETPETLGLSSPEVAPEASPGETPESLGLTRQDDEVAPEATTEAPEAVTEEAPEEDVSEQPQETENNQDQE